MDTKSNNEIEQNQENSKLKESANNNTVNSDETKISSPEKESNPKKEEKEEKEENKNKDNLDIKTPKSEEQKDNKKYEKELELIKELKKDNYKKLYLIRKYYDYRTRENKDWKFGIISRIDEDSLIIENIEKDKKSQIKIDDSFKLSYSRKYSEATEENHLKKRDNSSNLLSRLENLVKYIKKENNIFKNENEKIRKIPDFCLLYEEKKEEQKKGKKVKKEENEKEEETEKEEKVVKKDEKEKNDEKKEEKDKNLEKKFGLKKICLPSAYSYSTTYTSDQTKIKAPILAYFIDYFHALNGFYYLYQLCYSNDSINLELLLIIYNSLGYPKSMTGLFGGGCTIITISKVVSKNGKMIQNKRKKMIMKICPKLLMIF